MPAAELVREGNETGVERCGAEVSVEEPGSELRAPLADRLPTARMAALEAARRSSRRTLPEVTEVFAMCERPEAW